MTRQPEPNTPGLLFVTKAVVGCDGRVWTEDHDLWYSGRSTLTSEELENRYSPLHPLLWADGHKALDAEDVRYAVSLLHDQSILDDEARIAVADALDWCFGPNYLGKRGAHPE